jgi:YHS domain-containing protein
MEILMSLIVLLAASLTVASPPKPLVCPVTYDELTKESKSAVYAGIRVSFCCSDCPSGFAANPTGALEKAGKEGKTVGAFLFDPVSRKPVSAAKAPGGTEDYQGIRYYFETTVDKATFDKKPAAYTAVPKKESMVCPVTKESVGGYDKASGYADYKGVRYYFCCSDCDKPFASNPELYVKGVAAKVQAPKIVPISAGGQ